MRGRGRSWSTRTRGMWSMWFYRSWRSGRERRRTRGWWGGSGRFGRGMSRRGFRGGKRSGIVSKGSEWRKKGSGNTGGGNGGIMIDDGNGVSQCIAHSWAAYLACCFWGRWFSVLSCASRSDRHRHTQEPWWPYRRGILKRAKRVEILPTNSIRNATNDGHHLRPSIPVSCSLTKRP